MESRRYSNKGDLAEKKIAWSDIASESRQRIVTVILEENVRMI